MLSPGGIATGSPSKPIKNCFYVCYSLVGLMDTSPFGFQSWVLWGLVPPVKVLKAGVLDIGSKLFAPHGEARSYEFPTDCMSLGWGLW